MHVLTREELQIIATKKSQKTSVDEDVSEAKNTLQASTNEEDQTQKKDTLSDRVTTMSQSRKWSCSEVTLRAVNQKYHLGLDEKALQMMAGFSGGMMQEDVCGVVVASVASLSLQYTNESAHESPELKLVLEKYFEAFKQTFESTKCKSIKITHRDHETNSCLPVILKNSDIVKAFLKKEA